MVIFRKTVIIFLGRDTFQYVSQCYKQRNQQDVSQYYKQRNQQSHVTSSPKSIYYELGATNLYLEGAAISVNTIC